MGIFDRKKGKEEDGFTSYFKCNGDIEVQVAKDGTEIFQLPRNYKWAGTVEEDEILCPTCGEEIHYNGEYVCVHCEGTFSEEELEEYCGCGVTHG